MSKKEFLDYVEDCLNWFSLFSACIIVWFLIIYGIYRLVQWIA